MFFLKSFLFVFKLHLTVFLFLSLLYVKHFELQFLYEKVLYIQIKLIIIIMKPVKDISAPADRDSRSYTLTLCRTCCDIMWDGLLQRSFNIWEANQDKGIKVTCVSNKSASSWPVPSPLAEYNTISLQHIGSYQPYFSDLQPQKVSGPASLVGVRGGSPDPGTINPDGCGGPAESVLNPASGL